MILYNSSYEFVGISDSCVKKLNFPSFNAIKYRLGNDFANLLIEKKGFVFNFKYISWIEYILQEGNKAKGIIKGGDNGYYLLTFSVDSYYFLSHSEKGYMVLIESMNEYDMDEGELELENHRSYQDSESLYVDEETEYYGGDESGGEFDVPVQESETFVLGGFEASFDDSEDDEIEDDQPNNLPTKSSNTDKESYQSHYEMEDEYESSEFSFEKDEPKVNNNIESNSREESLPPLQTDGFNFEKVESKDNEEKNNSTLEKETSLPPLQIDGFDFEKVESQDDEEKDNSTLEKKTSLPPLQIDGFDFEKVESQDNEEKDNSTLEKETSLPPLQTDDFHFDDTTPEEHIDHSQVLDGDTCPMPVSEQRQLSQDDIDSLINMGGLEIADGEDEIMVKNFSTLHYPLDEVAEELEVDRATLIDFLIDLVHDMTDVKSYIYSSIEKSDIKAVQGSVSMVKGICNNLRVADLFQLLEKIEKTNYRDMAEVLRDVNKVYSKVELVAKYIEGDGQVIKIEGKEIRANIAELNQSSLPDVLFQDMIDSFIHLFDSYKDRVEESLNPNLIGDIKLIVKEMLGIATSLNIPQLLQPLKSIKHNTEQIDVEYDTLIMDWIDLSGFVDKLR